MPLYEYKCKKCGHRFEEIQKYSDRPIKKCPKCKKGTVEKLLSAPAVQFKGSGWYVTDYARKGSSGAGSESGGKESKDSGKSDSKGDSKSESKGESKSDSKSSDKKSSSKD